MYPIGKLLLIVGIFLALVGLVLMFYDRIPFLGKLPGDINIEKPGFQIHIPLMTSLLLSVVLTLILWLISWLRGK